MERGNFVLIVFIVIALILYGVMNLFAAHQACSVAGYSFWECWDYLK